MSKQREAAHSSGSRAIRISWLALSIHEGQDEDAHLLDPTGREHFCTVFPIFPSTILSLSPGCYQPQRYCQFIGHRKITTVGQPLSLSKDHQSVFSLQAQISVGPTSIKGSKHGMRDNWVDTFHAHRVHNLVYTAYIETRVPEIKKSRLWRI